MKFLNAILLATWFVAGLGASAQTEGHAPFSMIVSSDTQYPWTNCTDGDCE